MRPSTLLVLLLALLPPAAIAFELSIADPALTVSIPGLPTIQLEPQAVAAPPLVRLLTGSDGVHQVSAAITSANAEASPRVCAGSLLRTLVARPGMPDRDNIYRAPLDQQTFLVLYVLGPASEQRLHAHLLSAASAKLCVELHVVRPRRQGEDTDEWRKTFIGSHIQAARE